MNIAKRFWNWWQYGHFRASFGISMQHILQVFFVVSDCMLVRWFMPVCESCPAFYLAGADRSALYSEAAGRIRKKRCHVMQSKNQAVSLAQNPQFPTRNFIVMAAFTTIESRSKTHLQAKQDINRVAHFQLCLFAAGVARKSAEIFILRPRKETCAGGDVE